MFGFKWTLLIFRMVYTRLDDFRKAAFEFLVDLLSNFYSQGLDDKKPFENLGNLHFVIRSIFALLSTIAYQYTIFKMIVILAYRDDNFTDIVTEGGEVKPALYLKQDQPNITDNDEDGLTNTSFHAGYVIKYEAALAMILVIDYCM